MKLDDRIALMNVAFEQKDTMVDDKLYVKKYGTFIVLHTHAFAAEGGAAEGVLGFAVPTGCFRQEGMVSHLHS